MKKFLLFNLISLLICGCTATHLIYVHETSIGIDVAASTEGTGRLMFGYDRGTYSIVPRKGEDQDAMSLVSFNCVYAKGLGNVKINHFVSSGTIAKKVAISQDSLKNINTAIFGGDDKCIKN